MLSRFGFSKTKGENYSWNIRLNMVELKKGKIKCAFCSGTGILPRTETMDIKCPVCRGESFVRLDKAIECPYCKGKGRKTANYNLTCQVCGGLGAVEVKDKFKTCFDCQGKGKKLGEFLPCTSCKGKGVVER